MTAEQQRTEQHKQDEQQKGHRHIYVPSTLQTKLSLLYYRSDLGFGNLTSIALAG